MVYSNAKNLFNKLLSIDYKDHINTPNEGKTG